MGSFHLPIWTNKARNCKPKDLTKHQREKKNLQFNVIYSKGFVKIRSDAGQKIKEQEN